MVCRYTELVKPGVDFYFVYFVFELILILVILFGYDQMASVTELGQSSLSTSRFSGAMVGFLFLHVRLIVSRRLFFLDDACV